MKTVDSKAISGVFRLRRLLLASTALVGVAWAATPVVMLATSGAFAAGGTGGGGIAGGGGATSATGAGGGGGNHNSSQGSGGGGGGAGTTGGAGGYGNNSCGPGGAGGQSAGASGQSGNAGMCNVGAGGGGGGAHGTVSAALPTSAVAGGNGGSGGNGGYGGGGGGGAGGYGAVVTGSGALGTLSVNVSGGAGGAGGGGVSAGFGGDGGIGLFFSNSTATSVTIGSGVAVRGGAGGAGAAFGIDGAGISGQNLTLTLATGATVSGGGTGNAVIFTGGSNTLSFGGALAGLTGNIANGGSLLTFDQATDTTLASAITGPGAVTKQGAGTLTLTGANSYTGLTTVAAGTLRAGAANTLNSASGVTLSGGTLDLNGFSQTLATLNGASGAIINLGSAVLSVGNNGAASSYLGTISGSGRLNKIGSNALTLGQASAYSGGTTLTAGTVRVTASGALGTGPITFAGGSLVGATAGGATLTNGLAFTGGTGTIANSLTGDANALTLTAANSAFDNTTVHFGTAGNAGVVVFDPNGATGANRQLAVDYGTVRAGTSGLSTFTSGGTTTVASGATLDYAGTSGTIANLQGAGTVTQDGGTLSVQAGQFAGSIKDGSAPVGLTKSGSGTLTLSGTNTYTGNTTLSGGRVIAPNTGSVFGNSGTATIASGAFLELNITAANSIGQVGGTLTGAGQIQKTGTGNLSLGGNGTVNVSLLKDGLFDVQAGSVTGSSNNQGNWSNNKGGLNIAAGATFDGAEGTIVVDALTGAGTLKGGYSGVKTTTIGVADGSGTFSGTITDSAAPLALTKAGTGTQILTGTNTYTGATTVSGGTLQIGDGGTSGSIAATSGVSVAGTLAFSRSDAVGLAQPVSGAGTLNQNGSGLLTLSGSNGVGAQFTGSANVNAGTLSVNGIFGDTAGNGAVVNVNNGGTLHGSGTIAGSVVVASGGAVSAGNSPGTLTVGGNYTLNAGSSSLFELGTPNVVGGGTNDLIKVGGNLAIGNGAGLALQTAAGGQIASGYYTLFDVTGTATGRFSTVTNGGVEATSAVSQVITNGGIGPSQYNVLLASNGQLVQFWDGANLSANQSVEGGAGTWSATNSNWTIQTGAINDQWRSQAAVFGGTAGGTVQVTGAQSFEGLQFKTGGYMLSGDALTAVADSGIGGATAASITVDSGVATTIGNVIQGSAGLTKFGGGTLTLSGASTYTGATTIAAGTLALAGTGTLSSSTSVTLASGTTFDISGLSNAGATIGGLSDSASGQTGTVVLGANRLTLAGAAGSFGGTITGTGGLTLTSGTQTLSGSSTYTGATSINGGTLQAGAANAFAAGSTFTVAAGGTLGLGGFDQTIGSLAGAGGVNLGTGHLTVGSNDTATNFSGAITGAGGLTKTGSETFTLSGVSSFTGLTTVTGGTLALASGGSLAGDVKNAAIFTNAGSVAGKLTNTATARNDGSISGGVNNSGTFDNNSTGIVTSGLTNTSGTTTNAGTITGGATIVAGTFNTNATTSIVNGTLTNSGTVNAQGQINGDVANNAGATVTVVGGLTGIGRFTNDGVLALGGNNLTIGSLAGTGTSATISGGGILSAGGDNASTAYVGTIAGATALTKQGSGTLTLSGANTYSGATTVSAGTLRAAAANTFSANSAVTVAGTGKLDLNGFGQAIASLTGTGDVTLGAGTLTTGGGNASTAFDGVISGSGGLTKTGSGTFTLSAANTFTGTTTVSGGTLALASGGSLAGNVSNDATFTNAGSVSGGLTNSGSATNSGTITGGLADNTGTYTQTAGATNGGSTNSAIINANGGTFRGAVVNNTGAAFNVGGAVTSNGSFSNFGTLSVSSGSSFSGATVLTNDSTAVPFGIRVALSGTMSVGGFAGATAGATLFNNGTLNLIGGVGDTTYAGTISGSGTVSKSGTGLQILTGANGPGAEFTGTAAIDGGTLRVDGVFGETASNSAQLAVRSGGTLTGSGTVAGDVVNNGTVAAGAGIGSVGHLTIGGGYTIATGSTNAFDLGAPNAIGGVSNDLVTVGRDLTINGGTLALTNVAASGLYRLYDVGGTVSTVGQQNAGFTAVTAANGTALAYAIPGQVNARVSLGGQIVQYWDGSDTSGAQAGAQGGSGTWSVSSANWTDDPVGGRINQNWQGQFGVFGASAAGGASTITVEGQHDIQGLQFAGDGYTLVAGLNGSLNLTGDPGAGSTSSTVRVDAGLTAMVDAAITGVGLNKTVGSGTLVLTGTNSFGSLTIADGTVEVRNGAAIADTAPVTIANVLGARLQVTTSETIGSLAGGGTTGGTVSIADGQTLTTGGNGTSTSFAGVIGGQGGLTKAGTGIFTLAGANTYTGSTSISAGTLQAGAANAFSSASAVTIAANGNVDLNGFDQTVASLSGAGRVTLGAGRLSAGGNNASTTYDGVISGTGGLTKLGNGTFTLTGANTYTGSTTISAGTLALTSGASLSSASSTLVGANLVNAGSLTGGLTNAGTFATTGSVSGGLTNTGTVAAASGRIDGAIVNGAGSFIVSGTVTSNGTFANDSGAILAITGSGAYGVAGLLTNAGSLTVASGGSLTARAGIVNSGAITVAQGGRITDALVNSGSVVNNGIYDADVTNAGSGTLTNSSASVWNGNLGGNAGKLENAGQWNGDAHNGTGGMVTNNGTWTTTSGTFANAGTLVTTGVLNGSLTNSGTVQAAGQINGAVANAAGASMTLTGTLSGVTALNNNGTFDLGGTAFTVASLSGSSTAAVLRNGTLVVNGDSGTTSYAGTITDGANPTSLVKAGSGTLTLTGKNTYTGGTTVQEGTLVATAANLGGGAVTNNTDFVIDQSTDASVDSAINGGGHFTKRGAGILTYAGTGTLTGATTVETGSLLVNGSLANSVISVASGATLGGSGTVGGIVTNPAAAVAPGAAAGEIGTLNVAGNVQFSGQSIYQVDAAASGQADRISATGTARIAGGTVNVSAKAGAYSASTRYTILSATGGLSGTFTGVTANFAFLVPSLTYDANDAYLTLVRNSLDFASVAVTRNQASVAGAVEATGMGSRLFNAVGVLSVPQARRAFDALAGEIHSSTVSAQFSTGDLVREAILDRLRFGELPSFSGFGADGIGQRFAPGTTLPAMYTADLPGQTPALSAAPTKLVGPSAVSVWGQGFGSFGSIGGNGNATRLDQQTSGFILGADMRLDNDWRVGVAGGYTFKTLDVTERQSRGTVESGFGALYASGNYGPVQLRLGSSYAGSSLAISRAVIFPGFSETDSARYGSSLAQAFGEVGYRIGSAEGYVEPFVGGAAMRVSREGFTERGGAAALDSGSSDYDLATSTVGVQAQGQLNALLGSTTPILLRGLVGYRRAYGDVVPSTLLSFGGGGTSFIVAGVPVARDAVVAEAGVDWKVDRNTTLSVNYTGQVANDRTQSHGVRGGFVYRW